MNDKIKYSLVALFVVAVLFLGLPALFATRWKSSTLDKVNAATDVMNKTNATVSEFEANPEVSAVDFDAVIAAYKEEQGAIKEAQDAAKSLGGFKGLDVTGDYQKATETSEKLNSIYGQLLEISESELASAEAEKLVVAAFESSGDFEDPSVIQAQADAVRKANSDYQAYLNSNEATDVERKLSEVLGKLADAFESTAQAMNAQDPAQIEIADVQLQAVLAELDVLDADIAAQYAADQQEVRQITGQLNAAAKELE